MAIDIVSIEASSSSSPEVEDSLDGFITVTRKNLRPKQASSRSVVPTAAIIAAELKKRSTPLLLRFQRGGNPSVVIDGNRGAYCSHLPSFQAVTIVL